MNLTGSSSNSQNRGKKGFALILTLALISFVFLLVITLVNQVRMEFSFTESRQNQVLAKAHARMGMMIAIGEIQQHLGPDTRVSATADIYDERLSFSENSSSVDLNEDGVVNTIPLGQRMWTGVWKNRGGWAETKLATRPLPENRDDGKALTLSWSYDSSYDPHPAVESAWLVSGNEGWKKKLAVLSSNNVVREFVEVPDGIIIDDEGARVLNQPTGDTYGQAENPWADHKLIVEDVNRSNAYYHPLLSVAEDEQKAWLLKYPVLGEDFDPQNPAHQNNWEQYLVGEPVAVPKTAIHDADDTDSGLAENQSQDWGERKGSYAYWVADEGVKAKINISVPELTNETKLKVASSPNIGEGSFGINLTPQKEEKRKDLLTISSLSSLLDVDPIQLKSNSYHSMTADSFGVLADVRTGGLKRDLSQAFSLDPESSEEWIKDFNSNFIFRDRVRAMKNIPLHAQGKRNEWYASAGDASVDDPNALLAGPPWSVLSSYHQIKAIDEKIETVAPNQFPRTVGDNSLIFGRKPPISPRNVFNNKATEAYPFFNCFSSPSRKIRPEPKNHAVLPILVDFKFSFCPIASDIEGSPTIGELGLALSPAVTLWNPYNHEMLLKDIYLEIPFSVHNGNSGATSIDILSFDVNEYDLYRKWWAYIYDRNNTEQLKPADLSINNQVFVEGKIKKSFEPWGLYEFSKGSAKSSLFSTTHPIQIREPGLLDEFRKSDDERLPNKGMDPNINKTKWELRQPPDSMFGIYLKEFGSSSDKTYQIFHEAPRESAEGIYFTFHSVKKANISVGKLFVKINSASGDSNVSLLPGEVNTFAVYNNSSVLDTTEIDGNHALIDVYKREDNSIEKASILNTDVRYNSNDPESVILFLKCTSMGIAGYTKSEDKLVAEKYNSLGLLNLETWGSNANYLDPVCLTLWEGNPSSSNPNRKILTKWTSSNVSSAQGREFDLSTTVQYLKSSLEEIKTKSSPSTEMLGMGWRVGLKMPGEKTNERISFVEFNARALVHSNQHGQGKWFTKSHSFAGKNYYKNEDIYDKGDRGYAPPPQLKIDPQYTGMFTYNTEIYGENINIPFNIANSQYEPNAPKSFPDVFSLPDEITDPVDGEFNNLTDVFARANLLGFGLTGKTTSSNSPPIFDSNANPELEEPKVPPSSGQARVGFWNKSFNPLPPYTGTYSGSRNAILFEVPVDRVLSVLEYRHANLNNYLHGPTYSLGNSYATTQVARHRTWGRVQNIVSKPTSEQGLTNLVQNKQNQEAISDYYLDMIGPRAKDFGLTEPLNNVGGWDWNVDFSLGFGSWRDSGSNSLNHQNTTFDHSYYLNRALLDGYFLSGKTVSDNFSLEANSLPGERYRPLLWNKNSVSAYIAAPSLEAVGNSRLVAYEREPDWINNLTAYNFESINVNSEPDIKYRYQTLAADLILDGAFNINSTSKDAWIAQLSSLRGQFIKNGNININETPVVRFINEPIPNEWNELRKLSDEEIEHLAEALIKQIKLRGPFLSIADFVNRRLTPGPMDIDSSKAKGTRVNFVQYNLNEWTNYPEDRYSSQGLRGAFQSAISEAKINDDESWETDSWIPRIPDFRYNFEDKTFYDSSFGLRASALNMINHEGEGILNPLPDDPNDPEKRSFGAGTVKTFEDKTEITHNGVVAVRVHNTQYKSTAFGEAPENLLAVEHLATGANKPGWVMQSDLLSPLIPVTSARSDTFVIRVQGDTNSRSPSNAWIELVVQRTPDYVKPDLDAPHHRPHEPFKDINLNGFWDNGRGEHWIDLNQNADVFDQPDLPGVGELGKQKDYRDGLLSDLKLNMDPQEEDIESQSQISYLGTNQRFGRKFKIVRFRWLRANEV